MKEEGIGFKAPAGVFYNPWMRFCRSMSSLAVGAIHDKIRVCDAFCASGIRGIRYALENDNVRELSFLDMEETACKAASGNSKRADLNSRVYCGNISKLIFDIVTEFLEIDPFGSPAPYLYDSFRAFNPLKEAYLSVTATDVAVLCGGKRKACLKNYHSIPMNNEFTHENGLRILIRKIAETAAEFNMGIEPLVSFSHKHYLKTVAKLKRGAERADRSMNSMGYVDFCRMCGHRSSSRFPKEECPVCGNTMEYAGELWTGRIGDKRFIRNMIYLNDMRHYSDKEKIGRFLQTLESEIDMPPYYYNIHNLCRLCKRKSIPPRDDLITAVESSGFKASKTHFSSTSLKTDASVEELLEVLE